MLAYEWNRVMRCIARITLVVGCNLAGVGWSGSGACRAEPAGDQVPAPQVASLTDLIDRLADGPIQVRQVARTPQSVDGMRAGGAAEAATGWHAVPGAWFVRVTDREYPEQLAKDTPCWIIRLDADVRLPDAGGKMGLAPLCAVVDAKAGILLEIFSLPAVPWWHRVRVSNEAATRVLQTWGIRAALPDKPPVVPLSRVVEKFSPGNFNATQQLIVRYLLYTSSEGVGVSRVEGEATVPQWDHEPAWCISKEGIHELFVGTIPRPDPGSGVTADQLRELYPRDEERIMIYSAASGQRISQFGYR